MSACISLGVFLYTSWNAYTPHTAATVLAITSDEWPDPVLISESSEFWEQISFKTVSWVTLSCLELFPSLLKRGIAPAKQHHCLALHDHQGNDCQACSMPQVVCLRD